MGSSPCINSKPFRMASNLFYFVAFFATITGTIAKPKNNPDCIDNICWNTKSYPIAEVEKLLQNNTDLVGNVFGSTEGMNPDPVFTDESSCKFCNSKRVEQLRPVYVKDVYTEKWRHVVNTEKYYQTISLEICSPDGESKCLQLKNELLYNYGSECKQKYSKIKFLALSEDMKSLESIEVNIKSGCVCTVFRTM